MRRDGAGDRAFRQRGERTGDRAMGTENEVTQRARQVADDYRRVFGQEIVSVILYGSALTADYVPGKSDLNLMIVLSEEGICRLHLAHDLVARWRKKRVGTPLFVTKTYIDSSLDTFPIEFLNIKRTYLVLQGEDVLAGLSFKDEFVRMQCERELKGKLLLLRQRYVETGGKGRILRDLIAASIPTFTFVFKGLLHILGEEVPVTKWEAISVIARRFQLDEGLFRDLQRVGAGTLKLSESEVHELFRRYLQAVRRLALDMDTKELVSRCADRQCS
jgi:predicted nucleotidyltransferase